MGAYSESDTPSTTGTPRTLHITATPASEDTLTEKIGGLIHPIGRKATKRKAKEQVVDPVLDLVTKEMSILRATNVKNNTMFE